MAVHGGVPGRAGFPEARAGAGVGVGGARPLASADVVTVNLSSVTVPPGSFAEAPAIGRSPPVMNGYRGSGSGLGARRARKAKSQPSLAWVMCSVYRAP